MATPPVFPHKGEALAMLDEELARVDLPTPTGFSVEKQKRPGSQKLAWWHGDPDAIDAVETLTSLAWLRTWLRITGGRALPAGGLRLHKDRVWLDRAIVGRLERDGILAFELTGHFEPSFVLTDQGREWLAATGDV